MGQCFSTPSDREVEAPTVYYSNPSDYNNHAGSYTDTLSKSQSFRTPSDREVEAPAGWVQKPRVNLAPPPTHAPNCIICGNPTTKRNAMPSNPKGNSGRPYYKCDPCGKFHCFADERGNDPDNPPCYCGLSSKRQLSGPEKRLARQVHYVCRMGGCDFYKAEGITVDERFVGTMARHYIV